jgi:hypothetical protein
VKSTAKSTFGKKPAERQEEESKEFPVMLPLVDDFATDYKKTNAAFHEGECYLKTKSDRFKKHWAIV